MPGIVFTVLLCDDYTPAGSGSRYGSVLSIDRIDKDKENADKDKRSNHDNEIAIEDDGNYMYLII